MKVNVICSKCGNTPNFVSIRPDDTELERVVKARCCGQEEEKHISEFDFENVKDLFMFVNEDGAGVDNFDAEEVALANVVDRFAVQMKARLIHIKQTRGWEGWDTDENGEDIANRMLLNAASARAFHKDKDLIDTANLAMFLWNMGQGDK